MLTAEELLDNGLSPSSGFYGAIVAIHLVSPSASSIFTSPSALIFILLPPFIFIFLHIGLLISADELPVDILSDRGSLLVLFCTGRRSSCCGWFRKPKCYRVGEYGFHFRVGVGVHVAAGGSHAHRVRSYFLVEGSANTLARLSKCRGAGAGGLVRAACWYMSAYRSARGCKRLFQRIITASRW
jgi:hypothetical protein